MTPGRRGLLALVAAASLVGRAAAQQAGSIRGTVFDQDFDAPLGRASVTISETGQRVLTTDEGNFVFPEVAPGTYTLVFSKDGYTRQLRIDVPVTAGQLTDVSASLVGDFVEMEEFMARDISFSGATEAGLLRLRFESPALMDSIGANLIKASGVNDAAGALRLIPGATTSEGRFPVIRGLPDRYVNSQINGVRLPTADADKRAVPLDLFPAQAIQSVQVSKTFTPDQQGDASGGAVNLVLRGIPEETFIRGSFQYGYNSQVYKNRNNFLTYKGGGIPDYWGYGDASRDIQFDNIGKSWTGAVGVSEEDAPSQYKWNIESGGVAGDEEFKIGGYQNLFWEQDVEYFNNGINDSLWVFEPGKGLVPKPNQGLPDQGDFKTSLLDITQGSQLRRWGWLGTGGMEFLDSQQISVTYLYTRIAEDVATLAEDTRGKEYYFPGYDPNDVDDPGNSLENRLAAPYLRTETLTYTEEYTQTLIFSGKHALPVGGFGWDGFLEFDDPELDWTIANSEAGWNQPDRRLFGTQYLPGYFLPGFPPFVPPQNVPGGQFPYKPAANFTLGNLQRTYQTILETSTQGFGSIKLPFTQWTDSPGFFKFGAFDDTVRRTFDQESFSNFNDNSTSKLPWDQFWSSVFPKENHPVTDGPPFVDVDYRGKQDITAWYAMAEVPLVSQFSVIGGARRQSTALSIVNIPEADATWIPPGSPSIVALNPGDADVSLDQYDTLPQVGFILRPIDWVTFRGNYAETIALPIFKELTPIQQQEYLGGDVFVGNPELLISDVQNWDLRLDLTPFEGGLLSASYFYKSIDNPIEYVQRVATFNYTTPINFPKGTIDGIELEARQSLGSWWEPLTGLTIGANATFINSSVRLPQSEILALQDPAIQVNVTDRPMTGAPDYLWNIFMTLEVPDTGTQMGVFYTVKGDTLVSGAGASSNRFIPDVYADEFGTLNLTISQKLGEYFTLTFQAKNLTDPDYKQVYRLPDGSADVLKSSYSLGIDLSIALSAQIKF